VACVRVRVEITRDKLQLVGVSAFLIAAKNAEPAAALTPDDCSYWTDYAYEGPEIAAMEARLLKVIFVLRRYSCTAFVCSTKSLGVHHERRSTIGAPRYTGARTTTQRLAP
jgi:hypothetical protein